MTTQDNIIDKKRMLSVLQSGKPVSVVRAGDGEGIVLHSGDDLQSYQHCINNVMRRQMGYEPTMSEVVEIRDNLQLAYAGADIVGVPMHSNLSELGKQWTIVQATVEPFCTSKLRTSTDIFYDMLYDGSLLEWLRNKPVVNYISCRDIDKRMRSVLGIKQVNSVIIAPEAKFTTGYAGDKHYPDQFNKMEWWMNNAPIEGNPCLVGAGVIGKIYCNWFRNRGGIAIDIGAVFDLLAGFRTRGPERGTDAVDNRWKL